jgi:hypothetical protein
VKRKYGDWLLSENPRAKAPGRFLWPSALTHTDAVTVNQLASEPSARRKQQRSDTIDRRCRQPLRPCSGQSAPHAPHRHLGPVHDADLADDVLDVLLDGLVADVQFVGYVLVRQPLDDLP